MAFGPMVMRYVTVEPDTVPVSAPLRRTVPDAIETRTGPETAISVCVNVHVIRAVSVWSARSPDHVPVSVFAGAGCVGVLLVHATVDRSASKPARSRLRERRETKATSD